MEVDCVCSSVSGYASKMSIFIICTSPCAIQGAVRERKTMLPVSLAAPLREHLNKVKVAAYAGSSRRMRQRVFADCIGAKNSKRVA
jgi:hypothetical protein